MGQKSELHISGEKCNLYVKVVGCCIFLEKSVARIKNSKLQFFYKKVILSISC
jgi:hypothetical protein